MSVNMKLCESINKICWNR